jgi:hypothetical protein
MVRFPCSWRQYNQAAAVPWSAGLRIRLSGPDRCRLLTHGTAGDPHAVLAQPNARLDRQGPTDSCAQRSAH